MNATSNSSLHVYRRKQENPYAYIEQLEERQRIKANRRRLEDPYAHADELDSSNWLVPQPSTSQADAPPEFQRSRQTVSSARAENAQQQRIRVERFVREQHQLIWSNRKTLFNDHQSRNPIDMIDPIIVLESLGYEVELHGALGQMLHSDQRASKVAGLIDKTARKVLLSTGFSIPVRNFTAAHELGHAVMHEIRGMHRDRATDGSLAGRGEIEREADIFASLFLMPKKLLEQDFETRFGRFPFRWNEETRFALGGLLPHARWEPASTRALSLMLSSASQFNGMNFIPLHKLFRVSELAMAIRLEELHLV